MMPDAGDHNEGFLLRWSRRKRDSALGKPAPAEPSTTSSGGEGPVSVASTATTGADPQPGEAVSVAAVGRPGGAEAGEGQAFETHAARQQEDGAAEAVPPELADVDIDALNYDSDYTRFLGEGVPEALRQRALRQLWRSNPILANVDGLNDYDGDFTDAALAVDVLKTAHRVGKGFLDDDDDDVDADGEGGEDIVEGEVETDIAAAEAEAEADGGHEEAADVTDQQRQEGRPETAATAAPGGEDPPQSA
jgi:hypothetical protein